MRKDRQASVKGSCNYCPLITTAMALSQISASIAQGKIYKIVLFTILVLSCRCHAQTTLDDGFHSLYNFNFAQAQRYFAGWQQSHPDDPIGPVAEGAGYLFSEFDRLGVLEIQLLIKDSSFESHKGILPDPVIRTKFDEALKRAESKANLQLGKDPRNRDALFALTLISGLKADYAALIEKHNMASLRDANQARLWGEKLLAIDPAYYDAYIASGSGKYVVGSLAAPIRWMLRIGGISGDKGQGMRELKLTSEHGHYLAPLARILLAIAYLRENESSKAQQLLSNLHAEFPENPLFPKALARLDAQK